MKKLNKLIYTFFSYLGKAIIAIIIGGMLFQGFIELTKNILK